VNTGTNGMILGSNTTANTLSNIIFHLLNSPHTLQRLQSELRSKFTDIGQIRLGAALSECEYLSACIEETLRLTPVIGGVTQRVTLADGIEIDGLHIPAGTDVGVPHHAIMRNPDYFENPWTFEPQRWMASETPKEVLRTAKSGYIPFGMGLTECPGKSWATIELKLTIARMLYRYAHSREYPLLGVC
jgi:cytochrome P450